MACGSNLAKSLLYKSSVICTQLHPFIYIFSKAAFVREVQSGVVVTEMYGLNKLKYLMSGPSLKKFADPYAAMFYAAHLKEVEISPEHKMIEELCNS